MQQVLRQQAVVHYGRQRSFWGVKVEMSSLKPEKKNYESQSIKSRNIGRNLNALK